MRSKKNKKNMSLMLSGGERKRILQKRASAVLFNTLINECSESHKG